MRIQLLAVITYSPQHHHQTNDNRLPLRKYLLRTYGEAMKTPPTTYTHHVIKMGNQSWGQVAIDIESTESNPNYIIH